MDIEDIEIIFLAVQLKDGSAHQVLTSKQNKEILLQVLAGMDGNIKLDKEIEPITLEYKNERDI